ncbi:DnaT-like ssDNA-binding protein [Pseudomonas aeruginosa]|uniref:DnaT-like ssDNA-binding protein n=1 Tax=Pseudomonas aeruginosa TaxID=287 RepID=UPI000F538487|nr:DnaT-like ssDNA-binding protein [Pseudomonas aeruginosa]RQH53880.1 hypothetical protein IPC105_06505 [Pseudomonas aeruginosa]HBP1591829.1 hypothetical protein [Pseudomonas aeruginosa]HCG0886590.1 hypothetical protein [Pseudomonas aeruginosa]HEJ1813493.1 hypothetical protein [Pseudomonas aeruginosa]HEJ3483982.1 hypothetical protein [Pseudomonas aeruginosa]
MAVVTEGHSANSYVSVDQATEYHAQRGNAAWASASNDSRSSALIRATDYIDRSYQFRGSKVDPDQPLEFPRTGLAWPNRKLQAATCELALLALDGPLDTVQQASAVKSETVGPLTTVYADPVNQGQPRYVAVDRLLEALTVGGGMFNVRVSRMS